MQARLKKVDFVARDWHSHHWLVDSLVAEELAAHVVEPIRCGKQAGSRVPLETAVAADADHEKIHQLSLGEAARHCLDYAMGHEDPRDLYDPPGRGTEGYTAPVGSVH